MVAGDDMIRDACAPSCPGAAAVVILLYQENNMLPLKMKTMQTIVNDIKI